MEKCLRKFLINFFCNSTAMAVLPVTRRRRRGRVSCGFFLVLSLILLGCATTVTSLAPPLNLHLLPAVRDQQLSRVTHWQLRAQVSVKTSEDIVKFIVDWTVSGLNNYSIVLYSPLGLGSAKMTYDGEIATLIDAQGHHFTAPDPEMLMNQHLGWSLPLLPLYYWVRGLAEPFTATTQQRDSFNHLIELQQAGVHVYYADFSNIRGIDLPTNMVINTQEAQLRVLVRQWEIQKF